LCGQLRAQLKERDIEGLTAKLDELQVVKEQQAGQIETLKQNSEQHSEKSTQTIRRLTDELNRIKYTLDDVTNRHRQVTVVAVVLVVAVQFYVF